jgi:hypothetical protein
MANKDKAWFERFEQASPEDRRRMLAERKAEESRAFLSRMSRKAAPDRGPEPTEQDQDTVRAFMERTQSPEPTDLDALD